MWNALHHALHSSYAYIGHTISSTEYQSEVVDTTYGGGRVGMETLLQYLFTHIVGHETFRQADTVLVLTDTRPLEDVSHWPFVSRVIRARCFHEEG